MSKNVLQTCQHCGTSIWFHTETRKWTNLINDKCLVMGLCQPVQDAIWYVSDDIEMVYQTNHFKVMRLGEMRIFTETGDLIRYSSQLDRFIMNDFQLSSLLQIWQVENNPWFEIVSKDQQDFESDSYTNLDDALNDVLDAEKAFEGIDDLNKMHISYALDEAIEILRSKSRT